MAEAAYQQHTFRIQNSLPDLWCVNENHNRLHGDLLFGQSAAQMPLKSVEGRAVELLALLDT